MGKRLMARAPRAAATPELMRTASLGMVCSEAGNETSVSKRHMVKPIPPSIPTMPTCRLVIPFGKVAKPSLTASRVKAAMPTGLPSSRPRPMPYAGAKAAAAAAPPSTTAVLARAKRGMIPKVERGER